MSISQKMIYDLMRGVYKDLKEMSREELENEVLFWREVFRNLDKNVKEWLLRVGSLVAIIGSDWRRKIGILIDIHFKPEQIEIGVVSKEYDSNTGTYFVEKRIDTFLMNRVIGWQFLAEREEIEVKAALEKEIEERYSGDTEKE